MKTFDHGLTIFMSSYVIIIIEQLTFLTVLFVYPQHGLHI